MPTGPVTLTTRTQLGQYVLTLFDDWSSMRREDREQEWEQNLAAFKADSDSVFWKVPADADDWQSRIFVRITKMKVMSAVVIVNDVLLQGGHIPFSLKAVDTEMDPQMEALAQMGFDVPTTEDNQTAVEDMQTKIQDQFASAKADRHLMRVVLSMALYGEGYIKAPVIKWEQKIAYELGVQGLEVGFERVEKSQPQPTGQWVSVWDMFRDFEVEDLQAGIGVIQRSLISPYEMRQKQSAPFFELEAIERLIEENANRSGLATTNTASLPPHLRNITNRKRGITYLEFWGRVPQEYLDDYEAEKNEEVQKGRNILLDGLSGKEEEVQISVANNEVVRVVKNPGGRRPFHRATWEDSIENIHSMGVADNVRDAQRLVNGAVRNFADNKMLSSNVMLGGRSSSLAAGTNTKAKPGKWFELAEDVEDVSKALMSIVIPDVGESLMSLIVLAERYADEGANLPKVLQGDVAEKKKPDTLGEINILVQQAGKYLGQVIRNIDEGIIEPWAEFLYHWNMLQATGPQGNFSVNATGFTSFQNRVVRGQNMKSFLELILSHDLLLQEAKLRPMLDEIAMSYDIDPDQVLLTMDEKIEEQRRALEMEAELRRTEAEREAQGMVGDEEEKAMESQVARESRVGGGT